MSVAQMKSVRADHSNRLAPTKFSFQRKSNLLSATPYHHAKMQLFYSIALAMALASSLVQASPVDGRSVKARAPGPDMDAFYKMFKRGLSARDCHCTEAGYEAATEDCLRDGGCNDPAAAAACQSYLITCTSKHHSSRCLLFFLPLWPG